MRRHKRRHPNIKRIIWSLGINDYLHRADHCYTEEAAYLKALEEETVRIFPNAVIFFILPYRGMKNINNDIIKTLENTIKANCPRMKVYTPPSLKNMVSRKGIHPNHKGMMVLTEFFAKRFVTPKQRPFKRGAGMARRGTSYAEAHLPVTATARDHPPHQRDHPPHQQPPVDAAHQAPFDERSRSQHTNPAPPINPLVMDMATAITRMLMAHKAETTFPQRPWSYQ